MSIEAMRELETLASVCPELNMSNYTEDDVRHLNDWAIEMSLLAEKVAAIQQAEAQQLATAIACGIPGMAKTTCPYCEQGFAFEHEQPTTGEPVQATPNFTQLMQILDGLNRCHSRDSKVEFLRSWIRDWTQHKVDKLTHPAPSVPDDVARDAERFRCLNLTEEAIAVVDSILAAKVGGKQ